MNVIRHSEFLHVRSLSLYMFLGIFSDIAYQDIRIPIRTNHMDIEIILTIHIQSTLDTGIEEHLREILKGFYVHV